MRNTYPANSNPAVPTMFRATLSALIKVSLQADLSPQILMPAFPLLLVPENESFHRVSRDPKLSYQRARSVFDRPSKNLSGLAGGFCCIATRLPTAKVGGRQHQG